MPIQLPNLDDRQFSDLMQEARALIPTYAPQWTNHNPSDPGITLIELFAYLTEMLIYRLNRVTDANVRSFLKLLNGPDWEPSDLSAAALAGDVRAAILALRKRERAVTCEDFETLALQADARVARAHCVPRRNLLMDFEAERAGNMSLIVVPREGSELETADIIQAVDADLDSRRLLTTLLHVVEPFYLTVDVRAALVPKSDERLPDEQGTQISERVVAAVQNFLHPLYGGSEGEGWPFGRDVFVSELYELLDRLEGVDFVVSVDLTTADAGRLIRNDEGELVGIQIKPYELVRGRMNPADVTIQTI